MVTLVKMARFLTTKPRSILRVMTYGKIATFLNLDIGQGCKILNLVSRLQASFVPLNRDRRQDSKISKSASSYIES